MKARSLARALPLPPTLNRLGSKTNKGSCRPAVNRVAGGRALTHAVTTVINFLTV